MTFEEAFTGGSETLFEWLSLAAHTRALARLHALTNELSGRTYGYWREWQDEPRETWIGSSDAERSCGV